VTPDLAALGGWLRAAGVPGEIEVEGKASAGSSNVTWFVRVGDRRLVVRHPPAGDRLPSANDVAREHRFLVALHGTAVPVPRPIGCCEDPTVLGVPFLVAERVAGRALHDSVPTALLQHRRERDALAEGVIDTLADLHEVDWRSLGFFAGTTPYLVRQVNRWRDQLERMPTAARLGGLAELTPWVVEKMPASADTSIVHGDYGLHNLLVGDGPHPRVAAVLDWELATIGDPVADVVNFLKSWGPSPLTAAPNPANDALTDLGAPSAADLLARYERRTGRHVEHRHWYEVFTLWKSVGILENLHARHVAGTGVDPSGTRFGELAAAQLARALSHAEM
jgi:aminoglycoside phosphotransferase (APT) family kinase protein